jgi:hypothetical protein
VGHLHVLYVVLCVLRVGCRFLSFLFPLVYHNIGWHYSILFVAEPQDPHDEKHHRKTQQHCSIRQNLDQPGVVHR